VPSPVYIGMTLVPAGPVRTPAGVDRLADRLANRPADRLANRPADRLAAWRVVVAEPTDAALAASAAGGDTGAFEMLVRRHYTSVWQIAFLSVRDEAAAEELAQDTFLRAYGALAGWRGEASLRTWLATICRRLCIDRARLKQLDTVIAPDLEAVAGVTSETEALAERFDLQSALGQLPVDEREAFLLVHHYGYSSFEAATLLGIPASTVRSRVGRARQRLAAELSGQPVATQDTGWPVTAQEGGPA
jgi:RNA polymerase sigma-70 factor, ECF subfamily